VLAFRWACVVQVSQLQKSTQLNSTACNVFGVLM